MIDAALSTQPYLVPVLFIGTILVTLTLRQHGSTSAAMRILFGLSTSLLFAVTLTPNVLRGSASVRFCQIGGEFLLIQNLLNVVLFVPAALLTVVIFGRIFAVLSIGIALSVCVEALQFLLPSIGRSCDISDIASNATGTIIGVVGGLLLLRTFWPDKVRKATLRSDLRFAGAVALTTTFIVGGILAIWASFPAGRQDQRLQISPHDRNLVERSMQGILNLPTPPANVNVSRISNSSGQLVRVKSGERIIDFTWPALVPVRGIFDKAPVASRTSTDGAVSSESLIHLYALRNFPWAIQGSQTIEYQLGETSEERGIGWRRRVNGVLMPMRLDVFFTTSGKITGFLARRLESPPLPKVTVTKKDAYAMALRQEKGTVFGSELLAVMAHGEWIPQWAIQVAPKGAARSDPPVEILINAASGDLMTKQ